MQCFLFIISIHENLKKRLVIYQTKSKYFVSYNWKVYQLVTNINLATVSLTLLPTKWVLILHPYVKMWHRHYKILQKKSFSSQWNDYPSFFFLRCMRNGRLVHIFYVVLKSISRLRKHFFTHFNKWLLVLIIIILIIMMMMMIRLKRFLT